MSKVTNNYSFSYSDAPFILFEPSQSVGIFLNLTAYSDDTIIDTVFTPASAGNQDTFTITLLKSSSETQQTLCLNYFNNGSGFTIGSNSIEVLVTVVDSATGETLTSATLSYGHDTPAPIAHTSLYEVKYISAPYNQGPNSTQGGDLSAFIIYSLKTYESDDVTQPTFTCGQNIEPDTFQANVTSTVTSGNVIVQTFVCGPYTLTNPDTTGVQCETVLTLDGTKKPPLPSPAGIKHYGTTTVTDTVG